jgi:hypothetical protein
MVPKGQSQSGRKEPQKQDRGGEELEAEPETAEELATKSKRVAAPHGIPNRPA